MKKIPKIVVYGHTHTHTYIYKPTHPIFWCMVTSLGPRSVFTPSHAFKCIFGKSDHGSVTMEKCSMTWVNCMVHDVNNPLV